MPHEGYEDDGFLFCKFDIAKHRASADLGGQNVIPHAGGSAMPVISS